MLTSIIQPASGPIIQPGLITTPPPATTLNAMVTENGQTMTTENGQAMLP